jgi:hypothetical protein
MSYLVSVLLAYEAIASARRGFGVLREAAESRAPVDAGVSGGEGGTAPPEFTKVGEGGVAAAQPQD